MARPLALAALLAPGAADAAWPARTSIPAFQASYDVALPHWVDFDGDGREDLVLRLDEVTWLRNTGGAPETWPARAVPGVPPPIRLAVLDLDGDGDPDVAANTAWYANDGAGVVGDARPLSPECAFGFADLDGDGDPDAWGNEAWCANDGRGRFGAGTALPGAGVALGFDAGADGDTDLAAIGSDGTGHYTVSLLENDGAGQFAASAPLRVDGYPRLATGDFDGDGAPDLVWTEEGSLGWAPVVAGGIGAATVDRRPWGSSAPVVGDLDGDGDLDVVVDDAWFEQRAGGGFRPEVPLPYQFGTCGILDLDGDGDGDLLDRSGWTENPGYADLDHDGLQDGAERAAGTGRRDPDSDGDGLGDARELTAGLDPTDAADADRDQDRLPDAVEAALGSDPLRGDTDGDGLWDVAEVDRGTDPTLPDSDGDGFADGDELGCGSDPLAAVSYDTDCDGLDDVDELALGTDPARADTDGDGLLDGRELDVGSDPTDPDSDRGGTDDGVEDARGTDPRDARDDWARRVAWSVGGAHALAGGDLDGDGDVDLAAAVWAQTDGIVVLDARFDGESFQPEDLPGTSVTVSLGDLDGDGVLDVLGDRAWHAAAGGRARTLAGVAPRAADTDGDGDLDVVSVDGDVVLEENTGGGAFAGPVTIAAGPADRATVGDLDGDGDPDVAWARGGAIRWAENLGGNAFGAPALVENRNEAVAALDAVDLQADGVVELVAVTDGGSLRAGGVGGLARIDDDAEAAAVGDLDGDGVPDLVRANADRVDWAPGGAPTDRRPVVARSGRALALADVDGDGDLDVVVGAARAESVEWYENALLTCFSDRDGDGYGRAEGPCGGAAVSVGGDCADGDPARHPGAAEVPGDGVDQDCNGTDALSVAAPAAGPRARRPAPPAGCDHAGGTWILGALAAAALRVRRRAG